MKGQGLECGNTCRRQRDRQTEIQRQRHLSAGGRVLPETHGLRVSSPEIPGEGMQTPPRNHRAKVSSRWSCSSFFSLKLIFLPFCESMSEFLQLQEVYQENLGRDQNPGRMEHSRPAPESSSDEGLGGGTCLGKGVYARTHTHTPQVCIHARTRTHAQAHSTHRPSSPRSAAAHVPQETLGKASPPSGRMLCPRSGQKGGLSFPCVRGLASSRPASQVVAGQPRGASRCSEKQMLHRAGEDEGHRIPPPVGGGG